MSNKPMTMFYDQSYFQFRPIEVVGKPSYNLVDITFRENSHRQKVKHYPTCQTIQRQDKDVRNYSKREDRK